MGLLNPRRAWIQRKEDESGVQSSRSTKAARTWSQKPAHLISTVALDIGQILTSKYPALTGNRRCNWYRIICWFWEHPLWNGSCTTVHRLPLHNVRRLVRHEELSWGGRVTSHERNLDPVLGQLFHQNVVSIRSGMWSPPVHQCGRLINRAPDWPIVAPDWLIGGGLRFGLYTRSRLVNRAILKPQA